MICCSRYMQIACPEKRKHLLSAELNTDNTTEAVEKTVDK
jgi:hypothetical protein